MRKVPVEGARLLGMYASYYRYLPVVYILVMFVAMPAIFFGIAQSFSVQIVLGLFLLFLMLAVLGVALVWWWRGIPKIMDGTPGHLIVLSQEMRDESRRSWEGTGGDPNDVAGV